jgi:hypothetical protein
MPMELALREVGKLAPLAVMLAITGIALAWMLQRQMGLGTWLLAAFLLGHGLVHIMFAAPPPTAADSPAAEFAFDPTRSWLVANNVLGVGTVRVIVVALVVAVVIGYGLTAMATVGILVPAAWWSALLIVSTVGSLALIVIGRSPTLVLGVAIDVVLLWVVFAMAWSPVRAAAA